MAGDTVILRVTGDSGGLTRAFKQADKQAVASMAKIEASVRAANTKMASSIDTSSGKIGKLKATVAENAAALSIAQREQVRLTARYGEGSVQADKAALAVRRLTAAQAFNTAELTAAEAAMARRNAGWATFAAASATASETVRSKLGAMSAGMVAAGTQMRTAGSKMTRAVSLPLGIIGALGVKTAMDYERNMHILRQATEASPAEMDKLSKLAVALGADIKLPGTSAADAAEAMLELSKAGLSIVDVMGATKGVLQLSAASNMSNADAALVAANALNAFKLKGDEALNVIDLLAAASGETNASLQDMAGGMKTGGGVFAAAGVPIKDFVTLLGLMARAGYVGDDSGTSLKSMLLKLQNPSNEAAGALDRLGLTIYDMNGRMKPTAQIVAEFSAAMADGAKVAPPTNKALAKLGLAASSAKSKIGGLNARLEEQAAAIRIAEQEHSKIIAKHGASSIQAQKSALSLQKLNRVYGETKGAIAEADSTIKGFAGAQASAASTTHTMTQEIRDGMLATIFGSDAVRAANATLLAGSKAYAHMGETVGKQGETADQAAAKNEGLAGAIDAIKSSLETLAITIIAPMLTKMAAFALGIADLVSKFSDLPEPVQKAALTLGALVAVLGPLLYIGGLLLPVFGALAAAIAFLLTPVGLIVAAIVALGVAAVLAYQRFEGFRNVVNAVAGAVVGAFKVAWADLKTIFGGITAAFHQVVADFKTIFGAAVPVVGALWDALWGGLTGAVKSVFAVLTGDIMGGVNGIIKIINSLIGAYNKLPFAPNIPKIPELGGDKKEAPPAFKRGPGTMYTDTATRTDSMITRGAPIALARGGLLLGVNRPTPLLVGEGRGKEDVLAVPHSKGGLAGLGGGVSTTNNFYGITYEEAATRAQRQEGWRMALMGRR